MSFRASSPKELVELERKAYEFMRKNLRGISKEKAEKRISWVRLQHGSAKMFATVYSLPRMEASERGMNKAIREYQKGITATVLTSTGVGKPIIMKSVSKGKVVSPRRLVMVKGERRKPKKRDSWKSRRCDICGQTYKKKQGLTLHKSLFHAKKSKKQRVKRKKLKIKSFSDSVWKVRKP